MNPVHLLMRTSILLILISLLPTRACADEASQKNTTPPVTRPATSNDALPANVTFTEHVAPILFQNCANCHRPGEVAPFSLLTYQDAKKRARQIAEVTAERLMPPWHADAENPPFHNDRRLTEGQIALLSQWHRTGAAEGDPAKLPPAPKFTEGWEMGRPDVQTVMPEAFEVPAEGPDIYRNFVFPLNFEGDKWVRAIELRPSARSVVHHALIFLDTKGTAAQRDQRSQRPGYNGFETVGLTFVAAWAPGAGPLVLPDDLAWRFPKGSSLVLNTHFHPSGKIEREASAVGLRFAAAPPPHTYVGIQLPPQFGILKGIDIPPGATNYTVRDTFTVPVDADAFAVGAHAHYLGKRMSMTATLPDGRQQRLLRISDWDFAWQEQYAFKERIHLPKGTRIESEIVFDNSADNPRNPARPPRRVRWGPWSTNEMGSVTVGVVSVRNSDAEVLRAALVDHISDLLIDAVARGDETPPGLSSAAAQLKAGIQLSDKNGDGILDETERAPLRNLINLSGAPRQMLNSSP